MKIENSRQLSRLFNSIFENSYNTVLIGGADEPVYLPADGQSLHHRIFFRHDYISSAFHEIAHWCIAGSERLTRVDFGYWYNPDGRTKEQQKVFELVEIKPQALEWHLSAAAGHRFNLSADNLNGDCGVSEKFAQAVVAQAQRYCRDFNGDGSVVDNSDVDVSGDEHFMCGDRIPGRARLLIDELHKVFGGDDSDFMTSYQREKLLL